MRRTRVRDEETLSAWRDFAIGLLLFFVAMRFVQSMWRLGPDAIAPLQALLVVVVVVAHFAARRWGPFTDVTGTVSSLGGVSAVRLTVVGAAVLVLMFGVWKIAAAMGGEIAEPLPWGLGTPDSGLPSGYVVGMLIYLLVTAPTIEELCFRGWVQRGLGRRFNPAITIGIPALLFAALHAAVYSDPAYLLIPFVLGLTLGVTAERTRSIWPSVVLHALWNFALLTIASRSAEQSVILRAPQNAVDIIAALAAIGLSSIVVLRVLPRADGHADLAHPSAVPDRQVAA
jgi:membrane protease YdiL (CAAX protease family)